MGTYSVSPASVTMKMASKWHTPAEDIQIIIYLLTTVSHLKLFLKASHLCVLVNSLESGNGSFELMGRHTGVPTGDVVTEGIMDEHVLVLNSYSEPNVLALI